MFCRSFSNCQFIINHKIVSTCFPVSSIWFSTKYERTFPLSPYIRTFPHQNITCTKKRDICIVLPFNRQRQYSRSLFLSEFFPCSLAIFLFISDNLRFFLCWWRFYVFLIYASIKVEKFFFKNISTVFRRNMDDDKYLYKIKYLSLYTLV